MIKEALSSQETHGHSPILLLSPTGVATFNIHATTIHAGIQIPIKDMRPLHGQSLTMFQEEMKHIHYILIDEMRFIRSRLLYRLKVTCVRHFQKETTAQFYYRSIILVGDMGQLPPVMDKPLYAGTTRGRSLWTNFTTVIKLETIFRQQDIFDTQSRFHQLLTNIHNATPTIDDWSFLQSRTNIFLSIEECQSFGTSIHLFATNILVGNHNKFVLQSLNMPIARNFTELLGSSEAHQQDDDQLEKHVLLCICQ
jgi:ATP-dependent DNA helicase PIF1